MGFGPHHPCREEASGPSALSRPGSRLRPFPLRSGRGSALGEPLPKGPTAPSWALPPPLHPGGSCSHIPTDEGLRPLGTGSAFPTASSQPEGGRRAAAGAVPPAALQCRCLPARPSPPAVWPPPAPVCCPTTGRGRSVPGSGFILCRWKRQGWSPGDEVVARCKGVVREDGKTPQGGGKAGNGGG